MRARSILVALACALLFGCGDDDGSTADRDAAVVEPDSGSPGGCATDDDCRRFSSTCDGCNCVPLLASDPDPVCEGMPVSCLIDPCETAGAVRCNAGTCELE